MTLCVFSASSVDGVHADRSPQDLPLSLDLVVAAQYPTSIWRQDDFSLGLFNTAIAFYKVVLNSTLPNKVTQIITNQKKN